MCKISVHKFLRTSTAVLLVFAFALGASGVQVAHAASLTVNTTDDNITSGDGFCTLREAITNANSNSDTTSGDCAAGTGDDSITFSVSGTITLASTLPAISDPAGLTIDGTAQSLTISGNIMVQVIVVNSGAALVVQNLTIANGRSGGNGGGIENNGTLTVTNTAFSSNFAGPGFSVAGGGGIWNSGTLTVTTSTFSGNNADYGGGGIWNSGTMTVINSTFSHNGAVVGGGIENNGMLRVTNSTFSANGALLSGGGIDNGMVSELTVTNSTFSGNSADVGGGIKNGGTLTVADSTFSFNSAGNGGGIRSGGMLTVIHSTVTNSTFSGNSAVVGGGIDNGTLSELTVTNSTFFGNSADSYGGGINGFVPVTLRNTTVANSPSGGNCSGSFIDGGGNLNYPDTTCPGINADPLLGPLQLNPPGNTATHALLPGSPAIDAAVLANCPPTDQRGVVRPQGAGCDIGAFELEQDSTAPTITITTPAEGATYLLGQVVIADYACQDEAGGSGLASCVGDVANGSPIDTSSVGAKTFTVNAEDHAGNTASLTHHYSVIYNFSGFFEPVDNPPTFNVVRAGARIPVKFSLSGNQGLNIFAEGYPRSEEIACPPSAPLDVIEQTLRSGSTSLSYDATTDIYNYKWKTESAWSGTCRQLIVRLNDGTEHIAYFVFR